MTTRPTDFTVVRAPRNDIAISRDGQTVAYVARAQRGTQLYLRSLQAIDGAPLRGTEGATSPFFSPDGQSVGFFVADRTRNLLYTISVHGGPRRQIAELPGGDSGADWGSDNTIVFGGMEGLFTVPASGGPPLKLTSRDVKDRQSAHGWPSIVPGRGLVLFSIGRDASIDDSSLAVVSLATGKITPLGISGSGPRFLPTGHIAYLTDDGALWVAPFDAAALRVGTPLPMENGVLIKPGGGRNYDVSDNGSLVYVTGDVATRLNRTLLRVSRRGEARPLRAEPRGYVYPRIAPDGAKAAVEIDDGRDRDIWIVDLQRESLDRLTRDATNDAYPVRMPDSRRVIYTTIGPLPNAIIRRNADGTGQVESLLTTPPGASISTYAVTSRGDTLIVRTLRALSIVALDGNRELRQILAAAEYAQSDAALSPDDNWVAYNVTDADGVEVFASPFPNVNESRHKVSIGGGRHPVWSRTGDEIFYVSRDRKLMSVAVTTSPRFVTRSPVELFDAAEYVTFPERYFGRTYDVARDGSFLMSRDVSSPVVSDAAPEVVFVFNWLTDVVERMKQ